MRQAAQRNRGRTPLSHARNKECVRLLIDAGADPNVKSNNGSTPLMLKKFCYEATEILVKAGANVNARNDYGYSVLSQIVKDKELRKDKIRLLIHNGVKIGTIPRELLVEMLLDVEEEYKNFKALIPVWCEEAACAAFRS